MNNTRYGFYLRPSYAMCRAQAEIHDLLARQYHLRAAGMFMPHATVKGFFRSDAPPATMVERLDAALADQQSFAVYNNGLLAHGRGALVLRVRDMPDGTRNMALQALHEAALDALLPLVDPQCDFTPREWLGPRFDAHLTLVMADLPETLFDELWRFLDEAAPIGPAQFQAEAVQLFAFQSADWAGAWWETLQWNLVYSWLLKGTS